MTATRTTRRQPLSFSRQLSSLRFHSLNPFPPLSGVSGAFYTGAFYTGAFFSNIPPSVVCHLSPTPESEQPASIGASIQRVNSSVTRRATSLRASHGVSA